MNVIRQLQCFPHIQTQIWDYYSKNQEYYYRNQVLSELRERTALRKEFHNRLGTRACNGKPTRHWLETDTAQTWFFEIHYWHLIRMINIFENERYKKKYSDFFDELLLRKYSPSGRELRFAWKEITHRIYMRMVHGLDYKIKNYSD